MTKIFDSYEAIESKPITWLWYPRIPAGRITILQGDPGCGKSSVAVQLAATLTQAGELPDGTQVEQPVTVIYQCSEDGLADTIKPRLERAGADCNRVIYINEDKKNLTLDDSRLEDTIAATGARLCVIDPLQAYLPRDIAFGNPIKMRDMLRKLAKIADNYGCAIVLTCHLSKGTGRKNNLYRSLGSIDIPAIARSVLMIVRDKEDPEKRYMFNIKNNLAAEARPIAFRYGHSGFEWIGVCDDVDLDELLSAKPQKATKRDKAAEELLHLLSNGDMHSSDILAHFAAIGISERTLKAAKADIGAISVKGSDGWYMSLSAAKAGI